MIRAMIVKELRETWWIAGIALALEMLHVNCMTTGDPSLGLSPGTIRVKLFHWGTSEIPFTGSEFSGNFFTILVLLALALGLRQSLVESAQGTYLFLLHRPWRREAFFLVKLAVGCGLLLACGGLPILAYAAWAATPGHVAAPFEWSMTLSAWWLWAGIPAIYLAAFLVGLRPVAWLGTRCLPLLTVISIIGIFQLEIGPTAISVIGLVVLDALLLSNICYVASTREYS